MNERRIVFNKAYWVFIYLVITDERYLNVEGKLLANIVTKKGYCESITKAAKNMGIDISRIWKICHEIENRGHVQMQKDGNKLRIFFDEKIQKESTKMLRLVLEDEF